MKKFIVHPSTGSWGLASPKSEGELLKELDNTTLPKKEYLGISSIILNVTNQCNMGCVYCSSVGVRSRKQMSEEVAFKTLEHALELEPVPRMVFHGSEPLLNMSLIRSAISYGESLSDKIRFYIQSNLTLLNDNNLQFFLDHKVGISTSIDGNCEQHNLMRPFRDGSPSYDTVVKNMKHVMEYQKGMCTATVINKHNVHDLDKIALDLEKKGVTHIQFIPAVKCKDSTDNFRPSEDDIYKGTVKLFEQTFIRMESGVQKAVIRNIPQFLLSMLIRSGVDNCRVCSSTDYYPLMAVDYNGDVLPCDYFFGQKEHVLGNVFTSNLHMLLNSPTDPRSRSIEESDCGPCNIRRICGGGCMADRLFSGNKSYYCGYYKRMFEYMARKIPELQDKGILKDAIRNL